MSFSLFLLIGSILFLPTDTSGTIDTQSCYVCSYFPDHQWKGDDDKYCNDPKSVANRKLSKIYKKDCKTVMPVNVTEGRYRCSVTIGRAKDDKPFYIRGCEYSLKDYGECIKEFDQATTCYCIPSNCNGSPAFRDKNAVVIVLHLVYHAVLVLNTNFF